MKLQPEAVHWNDQGLVPAIVQHARTRQVLMLAFMNRDSLARTLRGPHVWFWSRTRQELWEKGATSGNYLDVRDVIPDCDGDTLLVLAEPTGPVCHTGEENCFYQGDIAAGPEEGIDRIVKKIGEEAAEVVIAGKNGAPTEIAWEVADLLYHTLVLLEATGVPLDDVYAELIKRRK